MTEYERQKVVDFINGMEDEEKIIAIEELEKWKRARKQIIGQMTMFVNEKGELDYDQN